MMKVWKNSVHSRPFGPLEERVDTIREKKVFYANVFVTNLTSFFDDKSYGKNVKEIYFREFCLKEGYHDNLLYYGSRKKIIDCAIVEDFSLVLNMANEEYGKYLAELYLDRSRQFQTLNIKDFDSTQFVSDLMEFFKESELL